MGGIVNALTGKSVDPTIMSALSGSLTVEYGITIAPETVATIQLDAPIYERLMALGPPVVKPDKAAVYGTLTAASFTGSGAGGAFAAGGDPYSINPTRALSAVTLKSYGASGGVKDVDVIASMTPGAPVSLNMERFADDAEALLNLLYLRSIQAIDYDMIHGNATSYPNEFDGLETKVASGVASYYSDQSGGALTVAMINQQIAWMMAGGARPTAMYCHPVLHMGIVNAYESRTQASVTIVDGKESTVGLWATSVVTPAGQLPIVSDPRFTITSDGTSVTGDVFFAVEYHSGVRILYPHWMILPTAVPLGKVMGRGRATSTELAVWAHLALIERTNWEVQGRLANVSVSFTPSISTAGE